MTCNRCEESRENGARFCPYCGDFLGNGPPPYAPVQRRSYGFIFWAGLVAAVQGMLIMLFQVAAAWTEMGEVLDYLAGKSNILYYITPHIETLVTVGDVGLMVIYVLFSMTVTACLAIMLYQAVKRVRESGGDLKALEHTAAFEVPVSLGLFLGFELTMLMIFVSRGGSLDGGGIDIDSPGTIYSLLFASVYEELICRLALIGVPCLAVALLLGRKEGWWRYLLGGAEYERWMFVFILFSAIMFGAAHLDNWGSWKFLPTFGFGILAGYLFVKYGLHASIAAHFINDFLVSSQWAYGNNWMFVLGILAVGFCSLPYLVRYAVLIYEHLKESVSLLGKGKITKDD